MRRLLVEGGGDGLRFMGMIGSRRSYSWWDDHIRQMNYCRGPQDDLTDGNNRVKLMMKLMEEDGESFKLHAQMYYKKRPELLKLVEEFYLAYSRLAERYDQATVALQQSHQEATKTLPNHALQTQNFPSSSRYMDSQSSSPQVLIQSHKFYHVDGKDDAHTGLPCHFHILRNEVFDPLRWRRGLKQVDDMFVSPGDSKLYVPRKKRERNCNNLQEQFMKETDLKLHDGSEDFKIEQNNEYRNGPTQWKEDGTCTFEEENQDHEEFEKPNILEEDWNTQSIKALKLRNQLLQNCILQMNEDNENLHLRVVYMQKEVEELQVSRQDEHLHVLKVEVALESLREKHSELEEKLKVAASKRQKCIEMMIEREIKINLLEEHLQHVEVVNSKLKEEIKKKTEEVHELHVTVEEQCIQFVEVREKLSTLEKLIPQYENQVGSLTLSKQDLEQKVGAMEEEMQNLQDEKLHLQSNQLKLQCKMLECTLSRESLQEENSMWKEQANKLELRHMEEMDGLQREIGTLQEKMKALQKENVFFLNEFSCHEKEFEVLIQENHIAFVSSMLYEEKAKELIKLDINHPIDRNVTEIMCVDAEAGYIEGGADVKWERNHQMPCRSQKNVTETFPPNITMDASSNLQVANLGNQVNGISKDTDCKKEICVACTKECEKRNEDFTDPSSRHEITLKDIQPDHFTNSTRPRGFDGTDESNGNNHEQVWKAEKARQNLGIQKANLSVIEENGMQLISSIKEGGMDLVLYEAHVSKKDAHSQHDWRKVAEWLSLDARRLTTLEAGAWELKKKLEIIGSNQTNNLEFSVVQEQVKQTKNSILQLIRTNAKLMNVAKCSSPSDGNNDGLKKVYSEQQKAMEYARRESQKIGMLELELQQAQYIVLRIEEDMERQKSRATRRGPRVVLGDYLFGKSERRRFPGFCGRVETKDHCHIKWSLKKERSI